MKTLSPKSTKFLVAHGPLETTAYIYHLNNFMAFSIRRRKVARKNRN